VIPLWVDSDSIAEDDGLFAFARAGEDGENFALVVINASDEARVTGAMELPASLKSAGKVLQTALVIGMGNAEPSPSVSATGLIRLQAPPASLVVYEAIPATK
jgi:hypothetical protein